MSINKACCLELLFKYTGQLILFQTSYSFQCPAMSLVLFLLSCTSLYFLTLFTPPLFVLAAQGLEFFLVSHVIFLA